MRVNEIDRQSPNVVRCEFDSVEEFAGYAAPFTGERYYNGGVNERLYSSFYGTSCATVGDAYKMAQTGWEEHLDDTIEVARSAVETVETETSVTDFRPVWDVTGAIVDVGEYLAGVPECMIELPPAPTTKTGRVVTLVGSVSYSSAIDPETLVKRGKVITALALALSRLGIAVELYADFSAKGGTVKQHSRVLVKGPNDTLDPAKVLFAYANPNMLRTIALTAMHGLPGKFQRGLAVGGSYGSPSSPEHNLPEGTIYLPQLYSNYDVPDADVALRGYLRELGLTE